jgi:RNA polymerase sigma-70 factor (ECF subfamily)
MTEPPTRDRGVSLVQLEGELMQAWSGHDRDELDARLQLLARRAAEGDDSSTEALLRFVHRSGAVRKVVSRYVAESEIDEVEQRTLIAVQKSVGRFEARSRFMTWLHSVAVNTALAHQRSLSRRRETAVETIPEVDLLGRISSLVVRRADLNAAAKSLTPDQRAALAMWDEGYSYEDIAERMCVPVGTVRSRISRARDRLRELTEARPEGEEASR